MPVQSVNISDDTDGDDLYVSLNHNQLAPTVYYADDAFETVNWKRREESTEIVGALVWAYSAWNRAALHRLLKTKLGVLPPFPDES